MASKARKRNDRIPPNILALQKANIKQAAYEYLGVSVFFALLAIVVWIVGFTIEDKAHSYRVIFGVAPILLWVAIVYFVFFVQRLSIFQRVDSIPYSTEQSVQIRCVKLKFRMHPVTRGLFLILYLVFIDENKQKYYYIYPQGGSPAEATAKVLRHELSGNSIHLVCYRNTNIVKSFHLQEK